MRGRSRRNQQDRCDRAGADQHERGHPRRVVQRQELCDETAGRHAHDVRAGDAEPVEYADGVGDEVPQRVAGRVGVDGGRSAGVLDRCGPHPASARNGLLSAVFSTLDCAPRWRERLPEITAPTLVVHGAADPFFPVGNAKALAGEIPGATLLVLGGVGAELPSRAHAEVATAVLAHTAQ